MALPPTHIQLMQLIQCSHHRRLSLLMMHKSGCDSDDGVKTRAYSEICIVSQETSASMVLFKP